MDFIATYWWLWLVGLVVCIGYAVSNQLKRVKGMSSSQSFEGAAASFDKGAKSLVISGLLAWAFGILLLIAIAIHIINYAKC